MQENQDIDLESGAPQDDAEGAPDGDDAVICRGPLMGYNHNIKHKGRHFHIQTEDSGLKAPHIFTHLFTNGTILGSKKKDYDDLAAEVGHEDDVKLLMREQHKGMIRELISGGFDEKIIAILGSLEPEKQAGKLKRYRHQLAYAGREYSVSTSFYANVVSEVFLDGLLIVCERLELAEKEIPGSKAIEQAAQHQHKQMLRGLRDGLFDHKILSLLGSVSPPKEVKTEVGKDALKALAAAVTQETRFGPSEFETQEATAEVYSHSLKYQERTYDFQTRVFYGAHPHAISEVLLGETVLTNRRTEFDESESTRKRAQAQHKALMRELKSGELDETIALLDEIMEEEETLF